MCGRMTLTTNDYGALCQALEAAPVADDAPLHRPRYNVAPTDEHWVLRLEDDDTRRLRRAVWGFPGNRGPLVINARSESVAERAMFRDAFARRRCVVPADGFFEWKKDGKKRQPIWYHAPDGDLLRLAGLWELRADGQMVFAVLTTCANGLVEPVHDRMPVILPPEVVDLWLHEPARELLVPLPDDALRATPVSSRVNNVANDDPQCLTPDPGDPQQSLF